MKKTFTALTLVLLATGCATTANYEAALKSWVGSRPEELAASWGPPDQIQKVGSSTFFTYSQSTQGSYTTPGQAPTYKTSCSFGVCTTTPSGGIASQTFSYHAYCETTFTIQNDIIVSWRYEGNACRTR